MCLDLASAIRGLPALGFRSRQLTGRLPAAGLFLLGLLSGLTGPAQAVPFRPDALGVLRAEGRLPAVVSSDRNARSRGLDTPQPTAAGWLVARPLERVIPDRQAVVILVDFSDHVANQATYPPAHYQDMLFSVNTYAGGSMRDWYLENSYGQFNVTGTATIWLRMPQTYAYYVDGQAGMGTYPHNAQKLAEDAVAAADPYVDFSQFDNDGPDGIPNSGDDDGVVDALFIVHAGPGRETTGSNNDIHSHAWNMVNPPAVDGVIANSYSVEPDEGKRGVFGHEFGHVLGLPDLYDTDYSSSGVGDWCMMSFGSWGGGGATPVHFLAWCKAQLGFLDPTTPLSNQAAAALHDVEVNPEAYKLWTGGHPDTQYFMVENRQRVGSDVSLPGDGLIISHIDETAGGNSDETHPLVAIEQADGLFNLEAGFGSDAGDPWPGSSVNRNFTDTSTPSSRDYAGLTTQVSVRNISNSGTAMTADLEVETQPIYSYESWTENEVGGDGDGAIDPGEQWDLGVTIRNLGLPATGVTGTASSPGPWVTVATGTSSFGSIGAEAAASGTPPFRFTLSGGTTADGVPVDVVVSDLGGHAASRQFVFGVSDSLHVFRWSHGKVTAGRLDQWHIGSERNHTPGGSYAWKCGATGPGFYADRLDAALYTIPFSLATVDAVRFWHWISSEAGDGNTVWDGGVVEASVDGGPWTVISPDGGYPSTIIPNPDSPFPGGQPCFGGTADWSQARFDLSALSGAVAQLRFRFGSDGAVSLEGWYIDDVTIEGRMASGVDRTEPSGVTLRLGAPRPNPAGDRVWIDFSVPAGTESRLSVFDLSGRRLYTAMVPARESSSGSLSWNGRGADGARLPSGMYFLRLDAGGASQVRRVQLVR